MQSAATDGLPKTHYVTSKDRLVNTLDDIKAELKMRLEQFREQGKLLEAQLRTADEV